jgi:dolichyl-phosphate beta-glucosyltransferase
MPARPKGLLDLRRQLETGSVLSMASRSPTEISLVIPVRDGVSFIADTVTSSREFLARRRHSFEIIVVDDGSTDGSAAAIRPLTGEQVRLIDLPTNRGKFGALKVGMAEAQGACRIFTDADLPYDLEAIPYIAELINEGGFHVVVGDRSLPESGSTAETRLSRRLSSRIFSFCVRMLVTGGLFDSQCGLKGFRSDVAESAFPLLTDPGFSGDVELLYIALKYNLSIRRIPVRLRTTTTTTVRLTIHSLPMLGRILRLRHNWTSGYYDSVDLSRIGSQTYWTPDVTSDRT